MKKFKFKETVILFDTEYKKDQKLEIRDDGGVWDEEGYWLFDYNSTSALRYGTIINE